MNTKFRRYLTPKTSIPRNVYFSISILAVIVVVGAWSALTYLEAVDTKFLPKPHQVAVAAYATAADGSLFGHMMSSITVILSGYFLSSIIAIPLGIMMGSFRVVQAALEPLVNFTRYLPVTAMIPLLILWVGIGIEQKIAVIFIGTFFQQVVMFADVSARVPNDLLQVSYTLGASRSQVVRRVLLPATLPGVADTLRVTMGWAWTYLVVAELVAANSGLGYMGLQAMRGFRVDIIFVAIITIGILGLLSDEIIKRLRNRFLAWAEGM